MESYGELPNPIFIPQNRPQRRSHSEIRRAVPVIRFFGSNFYSKISKKTQEAKERYSAASHEFSPLKIPGLSMVAMIDIIEAEFQLDWANVDWASMSDDL